MTAFMIDLETLDTKLSSKVTQIGAVAFDPFTDDIYASCDIYLNPDFQDDRTVSASTLEFWSKQPNFEEMISKARRGTTIGAALAKLNTFMFQHEKDVPLSGDRHTIWANGITFDLAILQHASETNGTPLYWSEGGRFRDLRCMRGLKDVVWMKASDEAEARCIEPYNPQIEVDQSDWAKYEFVPHNAVHDCIYQAKLVQAYFRFLRS